MMESTAQPKKLLLHRDTIRNLTAQSSQGQMKPPDTTETLTVTICPSVLECTTWTVMTVCP
jgi:hypothetical protein